MIVEMFIHQKKDSQVFSIPHRYRIMMPFTVESIPITRRIHSAMIGEEPRSREIAKDMHVCQIEEDTLLEIAKEFELTVEDLRDA